ncbi:hypothetical protein TRFO_33991 [Tritrichomonas foetus]|uniref:UV excision repair protein RAD23 n=1 Tax=Tritrichomonas foetus TaxID=1144522 RepID=A0A1J4JLH9_9EUKA|nr:hypothetical protein TRFO_33991 [Tritrichomonas foetus]|eukprot:OHS99537.1 hypothetical protein TRFO_33991 [Tritrichomonas foetus]
MTFRVLGETFQLALDGTETVQLVKDLVSEQIGQDTYSFQLIFNGEYLTDEESLFCQIVPNSPENIVDIDCSELNDLEQEEIQYFDLPEQSDIEVPTCTPPDFEEKVSTLMELSKSDRESCVKALRLAFFNLDRAAEYLFSGKHLPDKPTVLTYSDEIPEIQLNGGGSSIAATFAKAERVSISKLMLETKCDYETVVQVYFAVDKDEDAARGILMNYK